VLAPTEGLGSAALVGVVLQMVSEPTLAVARTGQCADIWRMARVSLGWGTRHGISIGTGRVSWIDEDVGFHPQIKPFTQSEDESVSRVLCVCVFAPTEGLGGAALVGGLLQSSLL
jgi:hypothetical protein